MKVVQILDLVLGNEALHVQKCSVTHIVLRWIFEIDRIDIVSEV
jgi:hypothetical protein